MLESASEFALEGANEPAEVGGLTAGGAGLESQSCVACAGHRLRPGISPSEGRGGQCGRAEALPPRASSEAAVDAALNLTLCGNGQWHLVKGNRAPKGDGGGPWPVVTLTDDTRSGLKGKYRQHVCRGALCTSPRLILTALGVGTVAVPALHGGS